MEKEIIIPLENEKYNEYIERILQSRKLDSIKFKTSKHHIIPKCLGGADEKENMIVLYNQEHYYAHKLLALENPDNGSLQAAWNIMCHDENRKDYFVSAEDYAEARERAAKYFSELYTGKPSALTEEGRARKIEATKKAWREGKFNNRVVTDKQRESCSKASKAKWRKWKEEGGGPRRGHSEEWKKQHSQQMLENPPRSRECILLNTKDAGKIFSNAKEAGIWLGITSKQPENSITQCCNGKIEYSGKHPETGEKCKWAYTDNI